MKYLTLILAAVLSLGMTACAQKQSSETQKSEVMNKKVLVAYFSATGTTAREAKLIAEATEGTLFEITPAQLYTAADLDWNDRQSRSSVEMNYDRSRPEMKENVADMAQYDVVFIGYPIWWDLAPRVVNTFIESNDLKGKTVIPFATSGGSTIQHSVAALKRAYPAISWQEGKLLNGANKTAVSNWIKELNIK